MFWLWEWNILGRWEEEFWYLCSLRPIRHTPFSFSSKVTVGLIFLFISALYIPLLIRKGRKKACLWDVNYTILEFPEF